MNIKGNEKLIEVFGRWPSFHDAEVLHLSFDREGTENTIGPTAECVIHAWMMTNEIDEGGHFVLQNHVLVTFRFIQVSASEFKWFNQQNVLCNLEITEIVDELTQKKNYQVDFPSSYGLEGFLQCCDIEIVQVISCDAEGKTFHAD